MSCGHESAGLHLLDCGHCQHFCRENTGRELTFAVIDAVLSQSQAVESLSVTSGHPAASKAAVHLLVESQCPYRYPYLCFVDGETSAYRIQTAG